MEVKALVWVSKLFKQYPCENMGSTGMYLHAFGVVIFLA